MMNSSPAKVLVIDDERGPRESLRILLKTEFQVFCAEGVDLGLALLQEHKPDLVIMDIRMPGKSGIQGLTEIRQLDPLVSVVMLTGFGDLATAQGAIRRGANDYLEKPFDTHDMQEVVRRYVQRTQVERRHQHAAEELQQINQQLMEELARKERLARIGQQSAELAHDMRNPLTSIIGYLQLLTNDLKNSREQLGERWTDAADYLERIETNTRRCREISQLWMCADKDEPSPTPVVEMCDLLDEAVKSVELAAAGRGVRIEWKPPAEACPIAAGRLHVFRALNNLIVNALDAVANDTGRVSIQCRRHGGSVEIGIEDNGCGISPENLPRIFDPYFSTKGQNGMGLGLFITKKMLEEFGGMIAVESKMGEGTRFLLSFPLATGK